MRRMQRRTSTARRGGPIQAIGAVLGRVASGFGMSAGGVSLTNADRAYLRERSILFATILSQGIEQSIGDIVAKADGRWMIGMMGAVGLVGNDDGQEQRWKAARDYVIENIRTWVGLPAQPPGGPEPLPVRPPDVFWKRFQG